MNRWLVWMAVVALGLGACSEDEEPDVLTAPVEDATSTDDPSSGEDTGSQEDLPAELGEPVVSEVPPAVVPEGARANDQLRSGEIVTYEMPAGVTEADVMAWYSRHMPAGEDFAGLRWLEALPADANFGEDWYWCSGPAESIDVAFGEDAGTAYVIIARQTVSDGACADM